MLLEMKVFGLTIDPFTNAPIVILKDTKDEKALPIWIGILEASAIAAELEDIQLPRPMTHDLLKNILDKLDINVEKIEVTDLRDNVFYATIHLGHNNNHYKVDARPSDAIAVALRTDSPIFVDKKVVEKSKQIDMRKLSAANKDSQGSEESQNQKWLEILDNLTPNDFGRYKM